MVEVVGLLDDDVARTILAATSVQAMSASELAERCDTSMPTIYRRLEDLEEADLLFQRTRIDPGGDHHNVYAARFRRLLVELEAGEYEVELLVEEDPADRFTRLFEELG